MIIESSFCACACVCLRCQNLCKCMCFNQGGDMSTLKGGPLKLVDKFTYLESSVSSIENDINTLLAKAWTANDELSFIWKSKLTEKIKCSFFQGHAVLQYGCTTRALTKCMEKKLDNNYLIMLKAVLNNPWTQHPTKKKKKCCTAGGRTSASRKLSKLDEPDIRNTAGEVRTNSWVMYSCGLFQKDEQR